MLPRWSPPGVPASGQIIEYGGGITSTSRTLSRRQCHVSQSTRITGHGIDKKHDPFSGRENIPLRLSPVAPHCSDRPRGNRKWQNQHAFFFLMRSAQHIHEFSDLTASFTDKTDNKDIRLRLLDQHMHQHGLTASCGGKMPIRWPTPQVNNPSIARTPVISGSRTPTREA